MERVEVIVFVFYKLIHLQVLNTTPVTSHESSLDHLKTREVILESNGDHQSPCIEKGEDKSNSPLNQSSLSHSTNMDNISYHSYQFKDQLLDARCMDSHSSDKLQCGESFSPVDGYLLMNRSSSSFCDALNSSLCSSNTNDKTPRDGISVFVTNNYSNDCLCDDNRRVYSSTSSTTLTVGNVSPPVPLPRLSLIKNSDEVISVTPTVTHLAQKLKRNFIGNPGIFF